VYSDPASVTIFDGDGAEVIAKVVYGSGAVTISMNNAPAVNTDYTVKVIA
jgi:PHD/YefM family antitoxin component YafN of YafNO toxin-antitoxin module